MSFTSVVGLFLLAGLLLYLVNNYLRIPRIAKRIITVVVLAALLILVLHSFGLANP